MTSKSEYKRMETQQPLKRRTIRDMRDKDLPQLVSFYMRDAVLDLPVISPLPEEQDKITKARDCAMTLKTFNQLVAQYPQCRRVLFDTLRVLIGAYYP